MKRTKLLILIAVTQVLILAGQPVKSPADFLNYELGSTFTYHHQATEYFRYVADNSPRVKYESYGTTYEGRELGVAFISSPENLEKLEELRRNNLSKIGLADYEFSGNQIPFVWLSYNIHGNESVGMEAALKTLYTLVESKFDGVDEWLENSVIIIDPCLNPDGRDRYSFAYRMMQPREVNVDPNAWERTQPWPGSRSNHYFFDLNRDWTWQTQIETQQRLAFYQKYMPQVHADFHEMGSSSNYFFPPGADPWHDAITKWQREFHKLTGEANAELFDKSYRLYYTKETFDLFAPSFGDTWPLFNGAMGFTYEQAGGGGAGVAIERSVGDTLTLEHRIEGHFLSSMATIKAALDNREKLIEGFNDYFKTAVENPPLEYKSVIIKGSNEKSSIRSLLEFLDNNQIRYSYAGDIGKSYNGHNYLMNQTGRFTVEEGDILIPASQPQGHFVKVLLEPESISSDSLSYDLSAWSLPFIYNLKSYATKESIPASEKAIEFHRHKNEMPEGKPYAYVVDWNGFDEVLFLTNIYKEKIRIRYAVKPFTINGDKFNRGSLIIARGDNTHLPSGFDRIVTEAANKVGIKLFTTNTGMVEEGKDFGSGYSRVVKPPRIATIGGDGISGGALGEMWYLFEREYEYPLTIIHSSRFASTDLSDYDVLILTSGNHSRFKDKIIEYVRGGGKVLAIESAASIFSGESNTALGRATTLRTEEQRAAQKKTKSNDPELLVTFEEGRRRNLPDRASGAIYRVKLDTTHPYTYGLGDEWFVMKRSSGYPYLASGSNIGYITENKPIAGFAGYKYQEKISATLVIGSESLGRGEVVYISDNPYYRAFWKSGRVLLANILLK